MRFFKILWLLGCIFATEGAWSCPKKPIVFAGLDWDSARFHNAVARLILEEGYGCQTDEMPGSTLPLLSGLIRGDVHVTMEVWPELVKETWEKALKAKKVGHGGVNYPDAVQGIYVPRYVIEGDAKRGIAPMAPKLRRVDQLHQYKTLFADPEEPGKGRFYNCILGWACEVVNTKKLAVYGLDQHYTNIRPGAAAALSAEIASHYKRGQPIVAYYWGPTWVLGRFDLVKLQEDPYDEKIWERFMKESKPKKTTDFPPIKVLKGYNIKALAGSKEIIDFLKAYQTTASQTSKALTYLHDHRGKKARDAAFEFLKNHPEVWQCRPPIKNGHPRHLKTAS